MEPVYSALIWKWTDSTQISEWDNKLKKFRFCILSFELLNIVSLALSNKDLHGKIFSGLDFLQHIYQLDG